MRPLIRWMPCPGARWRGAVRAAGALAALATLAACAPLQTAPQFPVGRAQLVLPPGEWVDLGRTEQFLPLLPELGATVPLHTRSVGLRGPGQQWLALLQVQTNSTNSPRPRTLWTDECPQQQGVLVEDATAVKTATATLTSAVRIDCLRFKRAADYEGWLGKNDPQLAQWLSSHNATPSQSYSYLHYRYATEGGAYAEITAVVDQRLLRPPTHSNQEFLQAGQPAKAWVHAVALAVRQSTAMLDGHLALPPFPIAPPH